MKWIKASERLPNLLTPVEWQNARGGNIPLGKFTVVEMWKKSGAPSTYSFEWKDESPTPASNIAEGEKRVKWAIGAIRRNAEKINEHTWKAYKEQVLAHLDDIDADFEILESSRPSTKSVDKVRGSEYWKGFEFALIVLEEMYGSLNFNHPLNICDCVRVKCNQMDKSKIRNQPQQELPEDLTNPWPTKDVLEKLVWATEYLLNEKSYDGHGHEEVRICADRGKEILKKLTEPVQKDIQWLIPDTDKVNSLLLAAMRLLNDEQRTSLRDSLIARTPKHDLFSWDDLYNALRTPTLTHDGAVDYMNSLKTKVR